MSDRAFVMVRDNSRCQYCGDHAEAVDHIIPWSHSRSNAVFNLVAACTLCNSVASNKVFDTFLEKKNHILTRRLQMLSRRAVPIWFQKEIDELGGRLKQKIEADCIVVADWDEGLFIATRLAHDGFMVTFGNGDEMDADQLLEESRRVAARRASRLGVENAPTAALDENAKPCAYCGKAFKRGRINVRAWSDKKYCNPRCNGKARRMRNLEKMGTS